MFSQNTFLKNLDKAGESFDMFVHSAKEFANNTMAHVMTMMFFSALMTTLIFSVPPRPGISAVVASVALVIVWGTIYGGLMHNFEYYYDGMLDQPEIQRRVRATFNATIGGAILLIWVGRLTIALCGLTLLTMLIQPGDPQEIMKIVTVCAFGLFVFIVIVHSIATATPRGA